MESVAPRFTLVTEATRLITNPAPDDGADSSTSQPITHAGLSFPLETEPENTASTTASTHGFTSSMHGWTLTNRNGVSHFVHAAIAKTDHALTRFQR
jgi:hypothetical protein